MNTDWTSFGFERFSVVRAFANWDEGQREALRAWTRDPFFP